MQTIRKHPLLTAAALLILLLALLAWLFPGSRNIDVTLTATEYRLDDPSVALEHTVTIRGRDSRNRFGRGTFQGTISVSGLDGMETDTDIMASYGKHPIATGSFRNRLCTLGVLIPDWDYTAFLALLSTTSPDGGRHTGGSAARFLVSGPVDRDAAMALAAELAKGTHWETLFS